ncbi:DUF4838 domain-containing protein [Cohnella soli]|uniref:DUF4838 domain-containing protein n=1 Tax=Cohnella soli TaxID=425005 RepID=A0ABW0HZ20_9BACL
MSKMVNSRLWSILLVISIIASLWGQVAVHAEVRSEGSFPSDLTGHWVEDTMTKWVNSGLLTGNGAGQYRPNDAISRAEFAALIDRVFNLPQQASDVNPFADVKSNAWYAGAIANVYVAGMIQGTGKGKFDPIAAITRQDAAVIVARAFQLEDAAAGVAFTDASQISAYASVAVASLHSHSYIQGKSGNRFAPKELITRAEVVQMIDNVMGALIKNKGNYERDYAGNVVVNTAGVELKNLVIAGDLYITQGVGEGDVLLDGVTVKGKTYVFGGGINSVKIKDSRLMGTLIVDKRTTQVRVLVSGATSVTNVLMLSGGILEEGELTGAGSGFNDVDVDIGATAQSRDVVLLGHFGQVHHLGVSVNVVLKQGTVVEEFTFDAIATVTGDGTIRIANIYVSGSNLSKWPDKVNFGSHITVTIEGKLVDKDRTDGSSGSGTTTPTNPGPSPSPSPEPTPSPDSDSLFIVDEVVPRASVVVSASADEQTRNAASKLINYIKKSTGVELPLLVDRLTADKLTAENGIVHVEMFNPPKTAPTAADFTVQVITDGQVSNQEHPASVSWNAATKTATLTVPSVEQTNAQQSVKYRVTNKEGESLDSPSITLPANAHASLIRNSSFEIGYSGIENAYPWRFWYEGTAPNIMTRSDEQARTGKYSLKLSGTAVAWPNQEVVPAGYGNYEYSVWLYTPQGSTTKGTIQLYAFLLPSEGDLVAAYRDVQVQAVSSDGNWTQIKWNVQIPEQVDGTHIARVWVGVEALNFAPGEIAYLDDFKFVYLDAVADNNDVIGNEAPNNGGTIENELPESYDGTQIYVGKRGLTAQEQDGLLNGMLGDGFVIHQNGERITIAGPTSWGTEFGVDEFLERYVGVRWLMPGEDWEDVPQHTSLAVPIGDEVKQEPAFFSRTFETSSKKVRTEWMRNVRMHWQVDFGHNLFNMLPVSRYPQFYPVGTVDKGETTMNPCFKADGIVDESIRIINAYFDSHPEATSYSLGMNDTSNFCEGMPSNPYYPGKTNSVGRVDMSDIFFEWIDQVAEGVFARHPDKYLGTYAYYNVYDPPTKVKLDPRVVVFITDDRLSWNDGELQAKAHTLSEEWTKTGATVAFYDYVYGTPYMAPRTAFQLMEDQYRYAASIGVGAYYSELYPNFGEGPKPYLAAKLQWDPNQDKAALLDEWYERAVGTEAAADLKAYYAIWQRFWEQDIYNSDWFKAWKNAPVRTNFMPLFSADYLKDVSWEDLAESRRLLESAVSKAGTPLQKKRAQDLLKMFEFYELSKKSYPDISDEIADPTSEDEAGALLDHILVKLGNMDQRMALAAEFATNDLYFQSLEAFAWEVVTNKEQAALSQWIKDHSVGDTARRIEQLAAADSSSTRVRDKMNEILGATFGTRVVNPGFEDGMTGWFGFWDTQSELTNDAHSGNQAIKVSYSSREQKVFLKSGKTYKLSFYAKATGANNFNLLGINYWGASGLQSGQHVTVDSADYKKYTLILTPPEQFAYATIVIYIEGSGVAVYADDFTLTEWSPADEAALTQVTGENGTVQAVLDRSPSSAPEAADFTVQLITDGQVSNQEHPASVSWNAATKTATLNVSGVDQTNMEQSVKYRVAYNGGETLDSPAITVPANPQASLLRNSSFEIGYSGIDAHFTNAYPWRYWFEGMAPNIMTRSDEQSRTGKYSLKLSGTAVAWPNQEVVLTDYGDYEYSVWLYTPHGSTTKGTIQLYAFLLPAEGDLVAAYRDVQVQAVTSNGNWTQIKWNVQIPEQVDGTHIARVWVGVEALNFAPGEVAYLDDFAFVKSAVD